MNSLSPVSIVGVGFSEVGRQLAASDDELIRQALTAALADAGMTVGDLDGVSTMGGNAMAIGDTFGTAPLDFYFTSVGGPAFVEPAIHAISAVASGLSTTCVAVRLIRRATSTGPAPTGPVTFPGDAQFTAPFGGLMPASMIGGLQMRRYLEEFGATEEDFGRHVVNQRYNASLNEEAILREPLTIDDYLSSRYVSRPVRLLDCDYPVDSASAVIFTRRERAGDWRKKPVSVEAWALSSSEPNFFQLRDFVRSSPVHCARQLWSRTDLGPADVDCAQLYDGFTVITFQWLEALGFCGFGEAAGFIADGHTRLGGSLPLNTDGGACNMGRRHGANFCIEAVRQIRGECGDRQVPGAEVSVWTNSVGPFTGAVLLTA
ncbi:MAG TPA: thiolase family protein [Acidimicrobiales bacterium]